MLAIGSHIISSQFLPKMILSATYVKICHQDPSPFSRNNPFLRHPLLMSSAPGVPQLKKGPRPLQDLTNYNGLGGLYNLWLYKTTEVLCTIYLVMNIIIKLKVVRKVTSWINTSVLNMSLLITLYLLRLILNYLEF